MKRIFALTLALCLILGAAAGCRNESGGTTTAGATTSSPAGTTSASTTQNDTQSPGAQSDRVLRYPSVMSFTNADPHYAAQSSDNLLINLNFESFYYVSRDGQMVPKLATDHEISGDGLTYTFYLKKGVKFQTGGEMTSSDVLYSFDRACASTFLYTQTMFIDSYEAPDEYTFVVNLTQITPSFVFDVNDIYILSEDAMAGVGESFGGDAVCGGTGPYTITTWKPDERVSLAYFEDYHGDAPAIKNIEMPILGDYNATLMAFEAGDLDFSVLPHEENDRISGSGKYNVSMDDAGNTYYIIMNCDQAPFDDPLVRQALNYAINKDDVIYACEDGFGIEAYTLGSPNYLFGVPGDGEIFTYEYNPDKARELLAEAGYPDGITLSEPLKTMAAIPFSTISEVVQNQLAQVGVHFEIEIVDDAVYVGDVMAGSFTLATMGITVYVDASAIARAYLSSCIDGDLNLGRYRSGEVDRLLEAANSTVNQDQRLANYREAFDIASREGAYLPLYWPETGIATDPDLNFDMNWPCWAWSWNN